MKKVTGKCTQPMKTTNNRDAAVPRFPLSGSQVKLGIWTQKIRISSVQRSTFKNPDIAAYAHMFQFPDFYAAESVFWSGYQGIQISKHSFIEASNFMIQYPELQKPGYYCMYIYRDNS